MFVFQAFWDLEKVGISKRRLYPFRLATWIKRRTMTEVQVRTAHRVSLDPDNCVSL